MSYRVEVRDLLSVQPWTDHERIKDALKAFPSQKTSGQAFWLENNGQTIVTDSVESIAELIDCAMIISRSEQN
jgi:hypothetical protein